MNWFVNLFTAAKLLNRKLRKLGGKPIVRPSTLTPIPPTKGIDSATAHSRPLA
jgi:hypothetical protein